MDVTVRIIKRLSKRRSSENDQWEAETTGSVWGRRSRGSSPNVRNLFVYSHWFDIYGFSINVLGTSSVMSAWLSRTGVVPGFPLNPLWIHQIVQIIPWSHAGRRRTDGWEKQTSDLPAHTAAVFWSSRPLWLVIELLDEANEASYSSSEESRSIFILSSLTRWEETAFLTVNYSRVSSAALWPLQFRSHSARLCCSFRTVQHQHISDQTRACEGWFTLCKVSAFLACVWSFMGDF